MKGSATERARQKAAKQAARISQLEAENAELKARLEKLERLVARLQKDSSTSSKPPSRYASSACSHRYGKMVMGCGSSE